MLAPGALDPLGGGDLEAPGDGPAGVSGVDDVVDLGGLVGWLIFGRDSISFLLAIAGAALIVWLMERRQAPQRT